MRDNKRDHYKLFHYPLTAIIVLAVLWLTLSSDPTGGLRITLFQHQDKVVHMLMFGAICAAFYTDRWLSGRPCSLTMVVWCTLITIVLGGAIEIIQDRCIDVRSGDWADWAADIAGCLIASSAYLLIKKRHHHYD